MVRAEVASVPTEDVMFRAPVASVSLLVFSQFTSSERSCSAAFVKTVVSIFNGPS